MTTVLFMRSTCVLTPNWQTKSFQHLQRQLHDLHVTGTKWLWDTQLWDTDRCVGVFVCIYGAADIFQTSLKWVPAKTTFAMWPGRFIPIWTYYIHWSALVWFLAFRTIKNSLDVLLNFNFSQHQHKNWCMLLNVRHPWIKHQLPPCVTMAKSWSVALTALVIALCWTSGVFGTKKTTSWSGKKDQKSTSLMSRYIKTYQNISKHVVDFTVKLHQEIYQKFIKLSTNNLSCKSQHDGLCVVVVGLDVFPALDVLLISFVCGFHASSWIIFLIIFKNGFDKIVNHRQQNWNWGFYHQTLTTELWLQEALSLDLPPWTGRHADRSAHRLFQALLAALQSHGPAGHGLGTLSFWSGPQVTTFLKKYEQMLKFAWILGYEQMWTSGANISFMVALVLTTASSAMTLEQLTPVFIAGLGTGKMKSWRLVMMVPSSKLTQIRFDRKKRLWTMEETPSHGSLSQETNRCSMF